MDEQELLRRCLKQDKGAWDALVTRYSRLIYSYIHRVFRIKGNSLSQDTAADIFQEIFLNLTKENFRKLRQFKGRNNASLASWLRVITINFCLDYLKKAKVPVLSLEDEFGRATGALKDILPDQGLLPDAELLKQDRYRHLFECIESLSAQDKYLLEMHIYQRISLDSLRASLGISRSAVDMRKLRLLERLKKCFKGKGFQLD